jgi:tetratricopeptide (TPR) repeat protein
VLNVRRIKLSRLILWVLSIIFMSKALRNMPFFGIPGAVCLGLNVNEAWADTIAFLRRKFVSEALLAGKWAGQLGLAALLIFFILWIPSDRFYVYDVASIRFGFGYSEDKFSMGAMDFIRENPVEGNLYNSFGMGGLCMWKLFPEERPGPDGKPRLYYGGRRLFIDGRAELYGGPFVKEYTRSLNEESVWKAFDDKFKFQVVFLNWQASDTQPLMFKLYQDPGWVLCYGDGVGYVFIRNTPEHQAVIDKARRNIESPQFVDFAESYARLARSLSGIPSHRQFVGFQDRIWSLSKIENGDPRLGEEARRVSESPGQVQLDRRCMTNAYDRLREWVPVLPERIISPGEVLGQADFALLTGYPDLADALVNGLIRLSPDVAEFYLHRGQIYQARAENLLKQNYTKQGESDLKMALEYYGEAEKRAPDYPGLNLQILRLADRMGNGALTALYLKRCVKEVYPTVASAGVIGGICLRYNRVLEALKQFSMALEMVPERECSALYERIAFCHFRLRDFRKALPNAYLAVDLDEDNAGAWFTLGLVHRGMGRNDKAKEAFERCLKLNPDFQAAREQLQQLENAVRPPTGPAFPGIP